MRKIILLLLSLAGISKLAAQPAAPVLSSPANNAVNTAAGRTIINWTVSISGSAYSYQWQADTSLNFNSALLDSGTVAGVPAQLNYNTVLKDLYFNTRYYWRVRTRQGSQLSAWASPFTFKTISSFVVSNPLPGSSDNYIKLLFTFLRTGGWVWLQYDTSGSFNSPLCKTDSISPLVTGTNITYPLNYLRFNTRYYVRARAYNSRDSIPLSTICTFNTLAKNSVQLPLSPASIKANVGCSRVSYQTNPDNKIYYHFETDTSGTFNSALLQKSSFYDLSSFNYMPNIFRYNTLYYARVRVTCNSDTSLWSNTYTFTTVKGPRLIQPALTAPDTFLRVDSMLFRTDYQPYANRFEIKIDTTPLFNSPRLNQSVMPIFNNSSPSYETCGIQHLYNLLFNKRYYVAVRCMNSNDTSAWEVKSYSSRPNIKLQSPVSGSATTATNPVLICEYIKHAIAYQCELDTSPLFNSTLYQLYTNPVFPQCSPGDLHFGQKYYWRMRAISSADTSGWSSTWNFNTYNPVIYINTPFMDEKNVEINPLNLGWSQPVGVGGYHCQLSKDSLFSSPINRYISNSSNSSDTISAGLEYNTKYFFRVRGINSVDSGTFYSVQRFFTRAPYPVPAAPVLISPANGNNRVAYGSNIPLQWSSAANASTYEVQSSQDPNFVTGVASTITPDVQIAVSNAQPKTTYYWRVRGKNTGSTGPWSGTFNFTTIPLLYVPVDLEPDNFTQVAAKSARISWLAVPDVESYQYRYSNSPTFFSSDPVFSTSQNYADLSGLTPNRTYYWQVRSVFAPYASGWSFLAIFRTTSVGLNDPVQVQNYLYPNPSNGGIYLSPELRQQVKKISVYNAMGQLLKEINNLDVQAGQVDLHDLPKGLYTVQLQLENSIATQQLLLQ